MPAAVAGRPLIIIPALWDRLTKTFDGDLKYSWPGYFGGEALFFSLLRASVYAMSVGSRALGKWYFRREYDFRGKVPWWIGLLCRSVVFSVLFYIALGFYFVCLEFSGASST